MSPDTPRRPGGQALRAAFIVNAAVFILAVVTIAVVVNYFAQRPGLRLRIDATKTRAYSLSDQTRRLLAGLEGSWTIALIMVEAEADAATQTQVTEILKRYAQASPSIAVVRVDPTNPATLGAYEALLARLREHEQTTIDAYERALDAGQAAFATLRQTALLESGRLQRLVEMLAEDDPVRGELQPRLASLGVLGDEGGRVGERVKASRAISDRQPIPDYETARSILVHVLTEWSNELDGMAQRDAAWRAKGTLPPAVARALAESGPEMEALAQRLASVADPLAKLPVLELSSISRQLAGGEAAVIVGPRSTAVIPSDQLFPAVNRRALGDGAVAFDRRFRGEQVISAAIRSLLVERMPMVVFVHSEARSYMREAPQRADLLGVADMLQASRFDVKEWSVGHTERPVAQPGQRVVWIIVPPSQRQELETGRDERLLLRTAEDLVTAGESVIVNVYPSLLPRYRRPDPWQDVLVPFGMRPRTAEAIFESVPDREGATAYAQGQSIDRFNVEHPIGAAVNGQLAHLVLPVAIEETVGAEAGVRRTVLAAVQPDPHRWLEGDWARKMTQRAAEEPGVPFDRALPVVIAAERRGPEGRIQRAVLVGSGGWMLSYVADVYASIGGERAALTHPGNHELLLASVAWLAGMDELIAPSPVSRQIARLDGVDVPTRVRWSLLTIVGAPLGCLLLGVGVWLVRR